MSLTHWNYFLTIEDDVDQIAKYIEFTPANYAVYSIELARVLMTATQELDILLKQICALNGIPAEKEQAYRQHIPSIYPNMTMAEVEVARYAIKFVPFSSWNGGTTPAWWTANNKVKHERHSFFNQASLENMLNAVSALLIANLYFYAASGTLPGVFPGTKHFDPTGMVKGICPSNFGMVPMYEVP